MVEKVGANLLGLGLGPRGKQLQAAWYYWKIWELLVLWYQTSPESVQRGIFAVGEVSHLRLV